jgi:hypothetical protein
VYTVQQFRQNNFNVPEVDRVGRNILCEIGQMSVRRLSTGLTNRSEWSQEFSPLHVVQTDSDAQPASYRMDTGDLSSEVKREKRKAEHLSPPSAEFSPPYIFMV